jgi:hypothetical protein
MNSDLPLSFTMKMKTAHTSETLATQPYPHGAKTQEQNQHQK